jgi:hypothetical protein
MASRTLALTLSLTLAISASALAAGALSAKTYKGTSPAKGVDGEGHPQSLAQSQMTLKVARNGKTVIVHFASSKPILYCETSMALRVQTDKPAKISSSGSFRATIDERFSPGPGPSAIVQVVSGKFSGSKVHGTIRTEAGECSGSTSFSASA